MASLAPDRRAPPAADKNVSTQPSNINSGSNPNMVVDVAAGSRGIAGKSVTKRDRPALGDVAVRKSKRTTQYTHARQSSEEREEPDLMEMSEDPRSVSFEDLSDNLDQVLGLAYAHEVHQTHLENEARLVFKLPPLELFAYPSQAFMLARRPPDGLERVQTEVTPAMRSILVDWLIEVAEEYSLTLQTMFLTINYVDRFLCNMKVARNALQLLGVTSMLIASYDSIQTILFALPYCPR